MISKIIAWCARNPFLVFAGAILLVFAGLWCMQRVPVCLGLWQRGPANRKNINTTHKISNVEPWPHRG